MPDNKLRLQLIREFRKDFRKLFPNKKTKIDMLLDKKVIIPFPKKRAQKSTANTTIS